jgi:hypothetical protein
MVPLQDSNRVKVLSEHPSGHQTRDTAANDNGVLPKAICHTFPPFPFSRQSLRRTQT